MLEFNNSYWSFQVMWPFSTNRKMLKFQRIYRIGSRFSMRYLDEHQPVDVREYPGLASVFLLRILTMTTTTTTKTTKATTRPMTSVKSVVTTSGAWGVSGVVGVSFPYRTIEWSPAAKQEKTNKKSPKTKSWLALCCLQSRKCHWGYETKKGMRWLSLPIHQGLSSE